MATTIPTSLSSRLDSKAWTAVALMGLYSGAEALCGLFVGVYLWVNSLDFSIVCRYYITLFSVAPFFFILAGWYAQARDRLHMYRLGLVMHAVYYGLLLVLRERAPDYAVPLGAMFGLTTALFYSAANTFNYDVTSPGRRAYYFGVLHAAVGSARLVAPPIGGLIITLAPHNQLGYHIIFALVIVIYLGCFALSFRLPADTERRPFHFRRAIFPGRDQRDWRLMMLAAVTMAGAYSIFEVLLALLMFMETGKELAVGGYGSMQALIAILTAFLVGRFVPHTSWKWSLRAGVVLIVAAGLIVLTEMTVITLITFGLMRSVAGPLIEIPHVSLRMDTIAHSVQHPSQRIEYICAWEMPLALGRVIMLVTLLVLYLTLQDNALGLRIGLLAFCTMRIGTYFLLTRTDAMRRITEAGAAAPV